MDPGGDEGGVARKPMPTMRPSTMTRTTIAKAAARRLWLVIGPIGCGVVNVVEMRGLEPLTPAMRTRCSPS